jgi:hypothetical protein
MEHGRASGGLLLLRPSQLRSLSVAAADGPHETNQVLDSVWFRCHAIPMTYVTIEAEIEGGQIVLAEGAQLPERGRALVTLLPEMPHRTNWDTVESVLGVLHRPDLDSTAWQHKIRAEWDHD